MKTKSLTIAVFLMILSVNLSAQNIFFPEKHGGVLNVGVGIGGYTGAYNHTLPVFNLNYEFGVARNFTLAPFVTIYSYSDPYYRETVMPFGIKGTVYLDQLLRAGYNWDFYVTRIGGIPYCTYY